MTVPPLLVAATTSYAANCALGAGVATGIVRTGRWHWIHHAMYICTSALTLAAGVALLVESGRAQGDSSRRRMRGRRTRRTGPAAALDAFLALLPAAAPLAAIPFAGTHTRRHPAIALSAAPFYALALRASARR